MDDREALHTAARRFCIERLARLRRREDLPSGHDPYAIAPAALIQLPRYAALEAILDDIERIEPLHEPTVDTLIDAIEQAANDAIQRLSGRATAPPSREAIHDAGRAFHDYLAQISITPPTLVARLPYRRTLSAAEHTALLERLGRRWPLTFANGIPETMPADGPAHGQIALQSRATRQILGRDAFQRILAVHEIERVYELAAHGISRSIAIERFEPTARTDAACWTSSAADWYLATVDDGWLLAGGWIVNVISSQIAGA